MVLGRKLINIVARVRGHLRGFEGKALEVCMYIGVERFQPRKWLASSGRGNGFILRRR